MADPNAKEARRQRMRRRKRVDATPPSLQEYRQHRRSRLRSSSPGAPLQHVIAESARLNECAYVRVYRRDHQMHVHDRFHVRPDRLAGWCQGKFSAVPAVLASAHEQSVPIFQQLARGHPSGRDDVRAIPACLMTFRAAEARRDRCERVAALSTVARVGSGTRGPFEAGAPALAGPSTCPPLSRPGLIRTSKQSTASSSKLENPPRSL